MGASTNTTGFLDATVQSWDGGTVQVCSKEDVESDSIGGRNTFSAMARFHMEGAKLALSRNPMNAGLTGPNSYSILVRDSLIRLF